MKLVITKSDKVIFASLAVLLAAFMTFYFVAGFLREPVLSLRVRYEKEFILCKKNAKNIEGHGLFNVCEVKDVSGWGLPGGIDFNYIIFDSNDISGRDYCLNYDPNEILDKYFNMSPQQPVTAVNKLTSNYYELIYRSSYGNRQNCGEKE